MSELHASIPHFDWDTASELSWQRFETHVQLMMDGPLSEKSEKEQCAYLILWLGERGRDIFSTWKLADGDKNKLSVYLSKFKSHITPAVNPVVARCTFFNRNQEPGESMEQYVTALRLLIKHCDFTAATLTVDVMLRDRIICGIQSQECRKKLLDKGAKLKLNETINVIKSHESTLSQLEAMAQKHVAAPKSVDAIHKSNVGKTKKETTSHKERRNRPYQQVTKACYFCGGAYSREHLATCPAKGQTCRKCGKVNHFEKVCRSTQVNTISTADTSENIYIDCLTVGAIEDNRNIKFPKADLNIRHNNIIRTWSFKIDTGAQANVLPLRMIHALQPALKVKPTNQVLTAYGGGKIRCIGTVLLKCSTGDIAKTLEFFIVDEYAAPILGYCACVDLGLIQITNPQIHEIQPITIPESIRQFEDVFRGIGKMEGKVTIRIKPRTHPVVHPPRRVPFSLMGKLQDELKRLVELQIIRKVDKPTEWVNSMVVAEKRDGCIRLCLDPKQLNEAIIRPHYPVPTLEHITAKLHGHTVFTKLDARSGYWMLELTDEAADLTTFNTPYGRYQYTRLPFGLCCSQDEFQRRMEETFGDIDGVGVIADDLVVSGKNKTDHDQNLRAVMQRAREKNIRFNLQKSVFESSSIPYFGHVISAQGIQPDPNKVQGLLAMPDPSTHEELDTFLGMTNYLSRYIRDLSSLNQPLRALSNSNAFNWEAVHSQAVSRIKSSICENLHHFDTTAKEVEITTDASKHGLGAHLSIKGNIIAFASKSLTPTEQHYAQIEKELYAILFGCKKFHQYVYGRKITVFTDHRPLEAVMSKPIYKAPPRLQRMLIGLQPYQLKVIFIPGKDIPVADALSRLHPNISIGTSEAEKEMDIHVHSILKSIPISSRRMEAIIDATAEDATLQQVKHFIVRGWPDKRKQCPEDTANYWCFRDELAAIDGIILKGDRVVIPTALRHTVLEQLHLPHLGVEKTRQRARQVVYWPGLNEDIAQVTQSCESCARFGASNPKEPLNCSKIPVLPWQCIGCDLFTLDGRDYLVTCDYYSRWIEVDHLTSTTSAAVITKLKHHFSREGIPLEVRSDNGPQFSSEEFQRFAAAWDFHHTTSSPNHPQSNGLAEKAVGIAKQILRKSAESKSDPYLGLLEYRNTPVDGFRSPAQLLKSRILRSTVPCTQKHLTPSIVPPSALHQVRQKAQQKQQASFNTNVRTQQPLKPGQPVWVQTGDSNKTWKKAVIIRKHDSRSYSISLSNGTSIRRNRIHLKSRQPDTQQTTTNEHPSAPTKKRNEPAVSPTQTFQNSAAARTTYPTGNESSYKTTRAGRVIHPRKIMNL